MAKKIALLITAKTLRQLASQLFAFLLAAIPLVASTQMSGQPPNSWVSGTDWGCNSGFKKSGDSCVSIFAGTSGGQKPPNSWVSGTDWGCNSGFKKSGDSCVSIFAGTSGGQQPHASHLESDRLAAENEAVRQKQVELERQLPQQKQEKEEERRRREEMEQKLAEKEKNAGKISVDAANKKATVQNEKKRSSKQQAMPQSNSPISGGLPPLKGNN